MNNSPTAPSPRLGRETPSSWQPGQITLVGLGLLGASLAEAFRKTNPNIQITGVSSPATLEKAKTAKLIDKGHAYEEIDLACAQADLVILCTPIDHILAILKNWTLHPLACKPGCIITDVGSTKVEICSQGFLAFAQGPGIFIGSHPMAGSEKTGLEARDALLFQNASWVICDSVEGAGGQLPNEISAASLQLESLVKAIGARTTRMPPDLHDQVAAHVSHLPQLLSTSLASFIGAQNQVVANCLQIAGGGFRDMTRLAGSSFAVWEPILRSNFPSILGAIKGFQTHLQKLEAKLQENLAQEFFTEGNQLRSQLSTAKKGFSLPLQEILVDLEDRPGSLVATFTPLAAKGINILDVEILKVREGEGGVLLLGFHDSKEAHQALETLAQAGLRARLK